jgi:hypothetical protein
VADYLSDGTSRVAWCTSISNTSAPTTTELNAGVDLTPLITADGLSITTATAKVDVSALNSVDNLSIAGRRDDDIEITFKSQGDAAAPVTTFASRPTGYLVVRRHTAYATAWTAAQKVSVYPVIAGDIQWVPAAANELVKVTVPFMKSAATVPAATVA